MDSPDLVGAPSLGWLVESARWQRLQDHFARMLGVAMRTISPTHQLLVNPSWPDGFESEQAIRLLKIGEELEALVPSGHPPEASRSLTLPSGVTYAVAPIRIIPQQVIAYVVLGPLLVGPRESEAEFRARAASLDVDALWSLLLSLKPFTFSGIQSTLHSIEEIADSILRSTYESRQSTLSSPATQAAIGAAESRLDAMFRSLLETAMLISGAEGGSVMVGSGADKPLEIRVALGLHPRDPRSGHAAGRPGIADFAMQERRIFLIDAQTADERLRSRMNRPELISSLVAPLMFEGAEEPIGVLNLRTTNAQQCFTRHHIELLRRLLALVSAKLGAV